MNRRIFATLGSALAIASSASASAAFVDKNRSHGGHAAVRARPSVLDTSLERVSDHGLYRVRVEPLEKPIRPHRIHAWALTVEHAGKPVGSAVIAVDGGMPEHGHGYPTKPKVEAAPAGGYLIRGMKFSMRGWWELKLTIRAAAGSDQITFNMVI